MAKKIAAAIPAGLGDSRWREATAGMAAAIPCACPIKFASHWGIPERGGSCRTGPPVPWIPCWLGALFRVGFRCGTASRERAEPE